MLILFHGAVGYLDELLAFGIMISVGVIIYFVFAVVESKHEPQTDRDEEGKKAD